MPKKSKRRNAQNIRSKKAVDARSILKEHAPVFEDVPVLSVAGCDSHPHKNRAEALECLAIRSQP